MQGFRDGSGEAILHGQDEFAQIAQAFIDKTPIFKAFVTGKYLLAGDVYITDIDDVLFGFEGVLNNIT